MNGNGTTTATTQTGSRLVDDFLRRELRVGDPKSPAELTKALRRRYSAEAARLDDEGAGLPMRHGLVTTVEAVVVGRGDTAGSREERRVRANLESDLDFLVESRDNREWKPELVGWREVIVREFADGTAAARFAQDPAQRQRGLLAIRKLSDYSRLARLVGVVNLPLNCDYRRLACTIDGATSVVRILMGEALYDAGLADGGFIIQVPLVDIRQRRDSLVLSVRRLSGTAELSEDGGDWGNGVAAYRALLDALADRAATELVVYLREEHLSAILDGLVSWISRQDPEALRQVASTNPVEVNRLRRLLEIAEPLSREAPVGMPPNPIAAVLSYFVQSLQLFLDAFTSTRSGARLVDLAVPLPLAALQADEADREGRRILRELVSWRGELAREVECFLSCCGCGREELRCQVKLDKVLHDTDRAIDLYTLGEGYPPDQWGDEEQRAGVYGLIAGNLADDRCCIAPGAVYPLLTAAARAGIDVVTAVAGFATANGDIVRAGRAATARSAFTAAMAAADCCCQSRERSEALLRTLVNVPGAGAGAVPLAAAQVNPMLGRARLLPLGIQSAILTAIDVTETAVGDSGLTNVAGVPPSFAADVQGVAELIRAGVPVVVALPEAVAAILEAREAVQEALETMGNPANAPVAEAAAVAAEQAAANAEAAADPIAVPPPPAPQRSALIAAADAARAAAQVARGAVALQPPDNVEPTALWRTLREIAGLLDDALPPAGTDHRLELLTDVFEEQLHSEEEWERLVASLAPRCLGPGRTHLVRAGRELLYGNPNYRVRNAPRVVASPPTGASRDGINRIARSQERVAAYADTFTRFLKDEGILDKIRLEVKRERGADAPDAPEIPEIDDAMAEDEGEAAAQDAGARDAAIVNPVEAPKVGEGEVAGQDAGERDADTLNGVEAILDKVGRLLQELSGGGGSWSGDRVRCATWNEAIVDLMAAYRPLHPRLRTMGTAEGGLAAALIVLIEPVSIRPPDAKAALRMQRHYDSARNLLRQLRQAGEARS